MKELGNNNKILQFKGDQDLISIENVLQQLQSCIEIDNNLDEIVAFISCSFHDFIIKYPEAIFKLDIDIIDQILSSPKLKIANEEELFDIVLKLYLKSKECSIVFSYVIIMNLSSEYI